MDSQIEVEDRNPSLGPKLKSRDEPQFEPNAYRQKLIEIMSYATGKNAIDTGIGFRLTTFKTIFLARVSKKVSPQNFNVFMKNKVLKHSLMSGILSIGPSGQLLKRRTQLLIMLLRIGLHSQQTRLNGSID